MSRGTPARSLVALVALVAVALCPVALSASSAHAGRAATTATTTAVMVPSMEPSGESDGPDVRHERGSFDERAARQAIDAQPTSSSLRQLGQLAVEPLTDRLATSTDSLHGGDDEVEGGSRLASIVTLVDPLGDVVDPRGDIVFTGINSTTSGITAALTEVELFDHPLNANWQVGTTASFWDFDVNFDGQADAYAIMFGNDSLVLGGVFDTNDNLLCAADVTWSAAESYYALFFDTSCLTTSPQFRFGSTMMYEDLVGATLGFDNAPDSTWSEAVVNDAVTTTPGGCTPSPVPAAGAPIDGFVSLQPARLLDTRAGQRTIDCEYAAQGIREAGSVLQLNVAGRAGAPFGIQAAVLNITVTEPAAAGFVTVYPCGTPRPVASSLNYTAGATVANAVFAAAGATGAVCIFTQARSHLVVDLNGYYLIDSTFRSVQPLRLLDTRGDGAVPVAPIGTIHRVRVSGVAGAPADASTAVLNVTVTEPTSPGFITVFPCGSAMPLASNLNFVAGATVANAVVSKIGDAGDVCIFNSGPTHLVVDLNGYYGAGSAFVPIVPARMLDSRPGQSTIDNAYQGIGLRSGGSTTEVQIGGRVGIPLNASSLMLNVTATEALTAGYVTVFPCGIPVPLASNLNVTAGATVPNLVLTKTGANGWVCLFSNGPAHLIVDVTGYYL